MLIKLDNTVF